MLAVGTDASRLESVDAAERLVCDVTDRAATDALAADVATRHASLDGILHLVGGWKPGWSDEVTDWLNARLVTTLLNVSEAFERMLLAAPAGRLAIISIDGRHPRRAARRRRTPPRSSRPSRGSRSSTRGGRAPTPAAVTFVAKSVEPGLAPAAALRRRVGPRTPGDARAALKD